jgi:hypothetical protein
LLRRLAVTVAVALGCLPHIGETAIAANCAPLEMRLMQLQSRSDPNQAEMQEARSLLAQCNGTQTASALPWGEKPKVEPRQRAGPPNTVRTLCVRTCDGYYFPISFSTKRKYLEVDEAACQRLCPAGDASLYYHSRREGPEQMVSIEGTPYSELENAFRYRTVLDRSCTCGTPLPIEPEEILLATYSSEPAPLSVSAEDPQKLVDRLGALIHTSSVSPVALTEPTAAPETIRIVLPTGNAEQDQLLASSVPGKWFQKEPDVSYPRGPGDIACLSPGPACQVQ